jgi:uncharacterized protein
MARGKSRRIAGGAAPSRGRFVGTGNGPSLQPIDIGHDDYVAVIEPDTAFWALVRREKLADVLFGDLAKAHRRKAAQFAREIDSLRFGLKPSAVYFNPTERCNLNCAYCYIPETMRRKGRHMSPERLLEALAILKRYFRATVPAGSLPQIVFHGAEPMLNREAVFAGIEKHRDDFRFGVQTNATLLDDEAVEFLKARDVSIGISLDAPTAAIADRTRANWQGEGVYRQVVEAMDRLKGYPAWSVISTITSRNLRHLTGLVDFLHRHEVPTCLMNILRCTLPRSRAVKPDDASAARWFLRALERTHELYRQTGRKLIVGNFANILLAIVAPAARRLMCDISPCGGGRCFFALAPDGDLFPCSEFIGLESFRGGNLFEDDIPAVLQSEPFRRVTGRKVEEIDPCRRCAIRHFCGAPCPAEAHEMNGGMHRTGAFCEFYEEQVRYAFRLIADERINDFLWDGWDRGMRQVFAMS